MHIGDIEITLVSDGVVHVDAGGPFGLTPRALYAPILEPDANNLIPMTLNCLLVRTAGKTILIDTGLGNNLTEKQSHNWGLERPDHGLLADLARQGVQPKDIDMVINTHLHADHCAGNVIIDGDTIRPVFPNADYITQRREYEDAMRPNERTRATYFPVHYEPLVKSGQMRLIDGDEEILPGIHAIVTRGHTPAHMCIHFASGDEHGLYMADLASYAVHFERLGWMTAYDVEPLETLESKRRMQEWALTHNALLIWEHDPRIRTGRLHREGAKFQVEPLEMFAVK